MVSVFFLHGVAHDAQKELYLMFNGTTSESKAWMWVFECELDSIKGLVIGIISGIPTCLIMYKVAIISQKMSKSRKYDEKEYLKLRRKNIQIGTFAILIYFIIFFLTTLFSDKHLTYRAPDILFTLVNAGIIGFSISLYKGNEMRKARRRNFCSNVTIQLEVFKIEHDISKDSFHLAIIVFITALISLFFSVTYPLPGRLPVEITSSNAFVMNTTKNVAIGFVIIVGYFAGIVLQILSNIADIRAAMREYAESKRG